MCVLRFDHMPISSISTMFAIYSHLSNLVDVDVDLIDSSIRLTGGDALVPHIHDLSQRIVESRAEPENSFDF